jgi:hypothetical protein
MDVIAAVAIDALLGRVGRIGKIRLMTQAAGKHRVRTLQRVLGSYIVVEVPADPRRRVVTFDAGLAKHAIVKIIALVTAATGVQRVVESAGEVAALTGQRLVRASQRELGEIVAEDQIQIPGRLAVALLTIPA